MRQYEKEKQNLEAKLKSLEEDAKDSYAINKQAASCLSSLPYDPFIVQREYIAETDAVLKDTIKRTRQAREELNAALVSQRMQHCFAQSLSAFVQNGVVSGTVGDDAVSLAKLTLNEANLLLNIDSATASASAPSTESKSVRPHQHDDFHVQESTLSSARARVTVAVFGAAQDTCKKGSPKIWIRLPCIHLPLQAMHSGLLPLNWVNFWRALTSEF